MKKSKLVLAITAVMFGMAAANANAQDAVKVCPNNFKCWPRTTQRGYCTFRKKKSETCGMHSHPYLVGYTLKSGGTLNYILPDGTKVQGNPAKAGNVLQRGPVTHSHEAPYHDVEAIVVELKK